MEVKKTNKQNGQKYSLFVIWVSMADDGFWSIQPLNKNLLTCKKPSCQILFSLGYVTQMPKTIMKRLVILLK